MLMIGGGGQILGRVRLWQGQPTALNLQLVKLTDKKVGRVGCTGILFSDPSTCTATPPLVVRHATPLHLLSPH